MWTNSLKFRKKLEELLPRVSEFSKWNTRAMLDLVADKDAVAYFDRKTGKMEKREVYSFLSDYGNGWRYDLDILEQSIDEARQTGDIEKLKTATKALRTFKMEYMYDEYVPEYYEKDVIFDSSPIAQEAWLDRKLSLDEFTSEANKLHNELDRFENYTASQEAFRKYQQLYSLYYEDGTAKIDDLANGISDLSKTLVLREHREATRDFNEFIPIPGSLQTAYNEFTALLESQGIKRNSTEFTEKIKEWTKQNTRLVYSEAYYEDVKKLRERLAELQEKAKTTEEVDFDVSAAYKTISDLIYTYKDKQGQPDPTALGEDKLQIIKDLQQKINDFKFSFDGKAGLSRLEIEELRVYMQSLKIRRLTKDEELRYLQLVAKQTGQGLTIEETAEMDGIYTQLFDIQLRLPTEYYLDEMNFNLSKYNIKAVTDATVNDYINSNEFFETVKQDKNFYDWFLLNHVTKKSWDNTEKKYIDVFERTMVNSVTVPKDPTMVKTTDILDTTTGETISIIGVPNARHSIYAVKDKYRT
ncbi:MAG: hypothetical protein WD512_15795, partial [Candidatus Paceibacterota bacterium]